MGRLKVAIRPERAPDHEIALRAQVQGGVVSHAQLAELGLSAEAIKRRVRRGRLHALHRGVYAVGHRAIGVAGRRWAAVLAVGEGAVLSHASAGGAWGLIRHDSALMHVTIRRRGGRGRRAGVRVHRPRTLGEDDVTTLDGLPITTPARTLLDLAAAGLAGPRLAAALDAAERMRLLDFAELDLYLARHRGRLGTPSLRAQLSRYHPGDTRSELEALILRLVARHSLPRPRINTVVEGRERDFYWPEVRLVVEADSYSWHRSPSALEDDRERDVELALAGIRSLRFTWGQVTRRRRYVARSLRAALLDARR